MGRWWWVAVWIWCAGAAWGTGNETLALTVHDDNGDPDEERTIWTKTFFVDGEGRLVRCHTVAKSPYQGEPDTVDDVVFEWGAETVTWKASNVGQSTIQEARRTPAGLRYRRWEARPDGALGAESLAWDVRYGTGPGVVWEDESYQYHWSMAEGFSQLSRGPEVNSGRQRWEVVTTGSKLATLVNGRQSDFLLVNRSPRMVEGTYYGNFLEENGWVATGTTRWTGQGLWHPDPWVRLVVATYFTTSNVAPLWPAFVFERNRPNSSLKLKHRGLESCQGGQGGHDETWCDLAGTDVLDRGSELRFRSEHPGLVRDADRGLDGPERRGNGGHRGG